METICKQCNRVKLRAEESHIVLLDINTMKALENSKPSGEHYCRQKTK